ASRPLAERRVLWKTRFAQAKSASELIEQYEAARMACEIASARDRFALLEIMQAGIDTEQGVVSVLDHFAGDTDAQSFISRALLRRTTDARRVAAIPRSLFGERVDWIKLDRELFDMTDPKKRLERVRSAVLTAPSDPAGAARYIRLLAETGSPAEALAYGRRM